MATTNIYQYSKGMTFSEKKILLELAQIIYRGNASMVVHDYNPSKEEAHYRSIEICVDNVVVAEGRRLEPIFETIKEVLKKCVKK